MRPRPDGSERFDDLEAIEASLDASNPDLYRHLALYLQVLRQVLPARVEQACFHLATQVHPQRYAALSLPQRLALHDRLDQLIGRCSTLLTVEQLVTLASRMALEQRRRERLEQRRLLERLQEGQSPGGVEALRDLLRDAAASQPEPGPEAEEAELPPLPDGSVQLGLALPVGQGGFGFLGPIGGEGDALEADAFGSDAFEADAVEDDALASDPGSSADREEEATGGWPAGLDPHAVLPLAMIPLPDGFAASDPTASSSPGSPWEDARLPRDPLLLLRWLDGLEQALARRLRNLSHAINVELLRAGLSRGLLPVSLLDAVIAGQIEAMGAPANLLRLQVPFGPRPEAGRLQAMAVLLRPVDLELEEPPLRTCRRRLQQHRQEVRRMAQQFRRLQRRLQAREAERLWRQDIRKSRSSTP